MKVTHIVAAPPYYTNCFLLVGDQNHGVVIDPGADVSRFVQALEENHAQLTHIFLTHGHFDHVGAVEALREKYGAKLYMSQADAEHFDMQPDEYFTDQGEIQVDDMAFRILFTPGHTPGSVCIACEDLLFTGDTLFADDIGRTDLPGGSMEQMQASLRKLVQQVPDQLQVLPGHEEFSTMEHEKQHNRYLQFEK